MSQPTICEDLKVVRQQWLESSLMDFNELKARELEKLDLLEREAYRGWYRSLRDAETAKTKGAADADGEMDTPQEVETTVKGQAGDPRFLAEIRHCIESRRKLLGLDAPQQVEINDLRILEDDNWYGNADRLRTLTAPSHN